MKTKIHYVLMFPNGKYLRRKLSRKILKFPTAWWQTAKCRDAVEYSPRFYGHNKDLTKLAAKFPQYKECTWMAVSTEVFTCVYDPTLDGRR